MIAVLWIVYHFGEKYISSVTRGIFGLIAQTNTQVMHPAGYHISFENELSSKLFVETWSPRSDVVLHRMKVRPMFASGFIADDFTVANLSTNIRTEDIQRICDHINQLFPSFPTVLGIASAAAFLFSVSFWIIFFFGDSLSILFFGYLIALIFVLHYFWSEYARRLEPKLRRVVLEANTSVFNRHGHRLNIKSPFALHPFELEVKNCNEVQTSEAHQTGENSGHIPLLVRHNA
eukprot:TRINITY_DN8702_c0_g1_i15.p1 TRINITY_DN8702_c0_g1~~TRINITY_DN8702_c0_g1_i15.p1  ORF type:complete len:233 (+),score=11.94 TRINITY_DN8702_c0_g1_i15:164-862(+)